MTTSNEEITTHVRQLLLSSAPLALVVAGRVYPDVLPQGCPLPAITTRLVDSSGEGLVDGQASALAHSRVQIDVYAATPSEGARVRTAARLALVGFRGLLGDQHISGIQRAGMFDGHDAPTDGSAAHRYIRTLDVLIDHQQRN